MAGVTKSVSCSKVVSFSLMGRSKSEEKSKSSDDGKFGDDAFVTPDPTFLTNNDPAKSDEAASTALTDGQCLCVVRNELLQCVLCTLRSSFLHHPRHSEQSLQTLLLDVGTQQHKESFLA